MSPEEQLAWQKPGIASEPDGAELRAVAGPSKPRSLRGPGRPATDAAREGEQSDVVRAEPLHASDGAVADRPARSPVVREYLVGRAAWTTRLVRSTGEFESLADAWSRLLPECADANVFLSHEWMFSWWSAYQPAAELAIVVAEDRGRVRGIAPMMVETAHRAGVRVRVLRFIGDGTTETDHVNFLAARSERGHVLKLLLDALGELRWDLAEFNQVPEHSDNAADLLAWIERQRLHWHSVRKACPVRQIPSTKDEILAALPSRLRTSIRSSRKKLLQTHRVAFGLHERQEEIGEALETFFANHASRWQGKGQAGAFANARRRAFYAHLTPRLLRRGWLRFFYLKLDGRPVAHQYCFALDGTVMLLQEGFDFAHASDNVGNVLRSMVFDHLVDTRARCYDFLAGSSRHKQSWSDGVVFDLRISCARRTLRGWAFHTAPLGWERMKDTLRPWRDRLRKRLETPGSAPGAVASPHGE